MNLVGLVDRVASLGAAEDDTDEVRLRKRAFVLAAVLYALLAAVWGTFFSILGLWRPALIPFAYVVLAAGVLWLFATGKRFALARTPVLLAWLVLPLVFQVMLGGFVAASAVVLWSVAAPLGALIFAPRESPWWAAGFVGMLVVALVLDPVLAPPAQLTAGLIRFLFVLNLTGVGLTVLLLLRDFLVRLDRARQDLRMEQERSETLLLNVLPGPIAQRLKEGEELIADRLDEVSTVFADLVGFTSLTDRFQADQVVTVLDALVAEFDQIALQLGMEKIRTIGDNYMVVAGAPNPRPDHLAAAAEMALAMSEAVSRHQDPSGSQLQIRIGIDSGPVVAGVIGRHKFVYDVWGDSVNTASRMESHGEPGRIQVTPRVYERLRQSFRFVERVVQDRIVVERFDRYWNPDAVQVNRVVYRTIPDSTVRLANLQAGSDKDYGVLGNPDVRPEKTVQYQFGWKQQLRDWLGLDVTLFYKDITDLLGTEVLITYTNAEYKRLSNLDFGNVIGVTVALDQRAIGLVGSYVGNLQELKEVVALARKGRIKSAPVETRPGDEAAAALEDLKAGRVVGRVVLDFERLAA